MTKKNLSLFLVLLMASLFTACGGNSDDPSESKKKPTESPTITCNNNGKMDSGEECDGSDLGSKTCASIDASKPNGSLSCSSTCKINSSACTAAPATCNNNGTLDAGEECDGTDFGGKTCASIDANKPNGSLSCSSTCKIDSSACAPAPAGSCTEKANFYGQLSSDSQLTTTAPTVDAGLEAVKSVFDKVPTDWSEDGIDFVYTFSTPQQITDATIVAIPYKSTNQLYVQDKSGTYYIRGSQSDNNMIPADAGKAVGKKISFKVSKLRIFKGKKDTSHNMQQIEKITDISYGGDAPVYYTAYSPTTVPYSMVKAVGSLSDKKICGGNYNCFTLTDANQNKVTLRINKNKKLNNGDCVTYLGPFSMYMSTRQLNVIDFNTITK